MDLIKGKDASQMTSKNPKPLNYICREEKHSEGGKKETEFARGKQSVKEEKGITGNRGEREKKTDLNAEKKGAPKVQGDQGKRGKKGCASGKVTVLKEKLQETRGTKRRKKGKRDVR